MKEFNDVEKCKDAAELNTFVDEYLAERNLAGEEKRKTAWALFYRWKESIKK